jgi:heme O synthase-like polyprenyltransferase
MPPSIDQPMIRLIRVQSRTHRLNEFYLLTKPRVITLIAFTAVIGMLLTAGTISLARAVFGAVGIALVAAAAAATNCMLEAKRNALMARTRANHFGGTQAHRHQSDYADSHRRVLKS